MSSQLASWSTSTHHSSPAVSEEEPLVGAAPVKQPDIAIHKASIDSGANLAAANPGRYPSLHQHRDSVSTTASDSSGSSPTTTVSLLDSYSLSGTPSHSPDTPASTQSLGYAPLGEKLRSARALDFQPPALLELSRPSPTTKRARNLKNLAVNTQGTMGVGRAPQTATFPMQQQQSDQPSEDMSTRMVPPTPGFVKPHTPRRKGSGLGLTITTNAPPSTALASKRHADALPPTPSLVRPASLRHFPSSPSLNLLTSRGGPEGGMRLPPISTRNHVAVGFADIPFENEEDEEEQNFDIPQSREDKPEAYPDGPICIYDPHVYLYYEPSREQALSYDAVFNVASEVLNPLLWPAKDIVAAEADSEPVPPASTHVQATTEYVHVPWEHNTDIVPDLYRLVKIVDERVQQGKKVLIHCQCGVSRSASLIVAYGLYKNPSITVQEAYDAVKRRSKWIGPNMSLIMQLQEFRSGLLRTSAGVTNHVSKASLTRPSFNRSQSAQGEHFVRSHSRMPMSAPLPPEVVSNSLAPISTDNAKDALLDPGPSSAPSGLRWPVGPDTPREVAHKPKTLPPPPPSQDPPPTRLQTDDLPKPQLSIHISAASPVEYSGFSPTSAELALSSANAFGISPSAGVSSAVARSGASNVAGAPAPTRAPAPVSKFAQSSTAAPAAKDDSFGLTSPRETTFAASLSSLALRPAPPRSQEPAVKLKPILPETEPTATSASQSQARAELGARMGMTRRSNYDLRAAFLSGTSKTADDLPELPSLPPPKRKPQLRSAPSLPDFAESLMSPRASEFTSNPFRGPANESAEDARLWYEKIAGPQAGGSSSNAAAASDPRSPPQKGASPIVRSIFDVL